MIARPDRLTVRPNLARDGEFIEYERTTFPAVITREGG